jgi:hypothetical protein
MTMGTENLVSLGYALLGGAPVFGPWFAGLLLVRAVWRRFHSLLNS